MTIKAQDSVIHLSAPNLPWLEKYRPKVLADVVGNEDIISRLKVIAKQGNMPHMILSGAPGIGKTTAIMALARELLGDSMKDAVLELNASDDRGIDTVRDRIKTFAQKKVTLPANVHKIVILDEADSMTAGAQQALRRIMEMYSNTTRFALACNISSKIIEPIQSRCAILRFTKLSDDEILYRLLSICREENVEYQHEGLQALLFTSDGDMRQAINNLQSTFYGFGFINAENVYKVCDQPHPTIVQDIVKSCLAKDIEKALLLLKNLSSMGYSSIDIIGTFFKVVKNMDDINEALQLELIKEIGFVHMRVLEGLTSFLQLSGLIAKMTRVSMGKDAEKAFTVTIK
ncbi:Replication factor C subunit 2 [Rozella allomycis CSF55]|uniref:Replication factor C subunit 4 n=1 Tax=Rozella allomycis (strain CSF55) TaxID=988480 RepID=A0A075B4B8_ROZAC|nr:Replication factor C subunit 2 [Rozella allomycis CSF55]|eukprot:EPZ36200.1 Replication factor C subunit 2 [Rozella allomycis CSF55]